MENGKFKLFIERHSEGNFRGDSGESSQLLILKMSHVYLAFAIFIIAIGLSAMVFFYEILRNIVLRNRIKKSRNARKIDRRYRKSKVIRSDFAKLYNRERSLFD